MPINERPDVRTRFKKGQSGNPGGRPKGRKNEATLIKDVLFKPVRVNDGHGVRHIPKIAAALEVCLNNALKGDTKSFVKIMELAEKLELLQPESALPTFTNIEVRHVIVDPKLPGEEQEIG